MVKRLVWLDSAINDLIRLRKFIDKNNPIAAKRAAEIIREAAIDLIKFPLLGKPVNDFVDYRDLFIRFGLSGYILRYRIDEEIIYVIHLRHAKEIEFKLKNINIDES